MPIKIVETGSLDDKQFSRSKTSKRPLKWKIKEQTTPRKQIDPKIDPRRTETIDPQRKRYKDLLDRKQREMTDPTKKKKYQDLLDRRKPVLMGERKMTESEKRNYISRKQKRIKEGKEIIRKRHNIGGRANLLEEVGRLDAEKMNPNRRAEKKRVIGELNKGYKGGGMAQRGLGRAFMKGGKV
jgi:hypothetical protein